MSNISKTRGLPKPRPETRFNNNETSIIPTRIIKSKSLTTNVVQIPSNFFYINTEDNIEVITEESTTSNNLILENGDTLYV